MNYRTEIFQKLLIILVFYSIFPFMILLKKKLNANKVKLIESELIDEVIRISK